jgi:hypothetical protein
MLYNNINNNMEGIIESKKIYEKLDEQSKKDYIIEYIAFLKKEQERLTRPTYNCECCNYHTHSELQYNKHCGEKKHNFIKELSEEIIYDKCEKHFDCLFCKWGGEKKGRIDKVKSHQNNKKHKENLKILNSKFEGEKMYNIEGVEIICKVCDERFCGKDMIRHHYSNKHNECIQEKKELIYITKEYKEIEHLLTPIIEEEEIIGYSYNKKEWEYMYPNNYFLLGQMKHIIKYIRNEEGKKEAEKNMKIISQRENDKLENYKRKVEEENKKNREQLLQQKLFNEKYTKKRYLDKNGAFNFKWICNKCNCEISSEKKCKGHKC